MEVVRIRGDRVLAESGAEILNGLLQLRFGRIDRTRGDRCIGAKRSAEEGRSFVQAIEVRQAACECCEEEYAAGRPEVPLMRERLR